MIEFEYYAINKYFPFIDKTRNLLVTENVVSYDFLASNYDKQQPALQIYANLMFGFP